MSSGGPAVGLNFPQIEFSLADGQLDVTAIDVHVGADAPRELSVKRLASGDVGSLLHLVAQAARRLEDELPRHLQRRDLASRRLARASRFPLAPFLAWRHSALRAAAAAAAAELQAEASRRNACRIRVRFAFSVRALRSYLGVVAAFGRLETAKAIWEVEGLPTGAPPRLWVGAELRREAVQLGPVLQEFVDAGWPGLAFRRFNDTSLELYPGFAMFGSGDGAVLVGMPDTKLEFSEPTVAEGAEPASDATIEQRVWERANKDGSPDRRYADNRSVLTVRYGLLGFTALGHAPRRFLVSDLQAARGFATAFADYQRILSEEANLPRDAAERQASPVEAASPAALDRPVVTVPSPPTTARAHEYALAAAAGAVCAWGILVGPPIGGQAMDWVAHQIPSRATSPPGDVEQTAALIRQAIPANSTSVPRLSDPALSSAPPTESAPPQPPVAPPAAPPAAAAPTPVALRAPVREQIITRSGANIRSAPSGSADVLRTTSRGIRLNVFGRSGGWVRVGDAEAWGWIHSSLLEGTN